MIDMHMEVLKWMSFDSLKQELTKRGLPTDGLEPVLLERLVHWHRQQHIDSAASNDAFHKLTDCVNGDDELISVVTAWEVSLFGTSRSEAQIALHEAQVAEAKTRRAKTQADLKKLERRLSFSPKLPTSVLLSILGQLRKQAGKRAACVKREWTVTVRTAKEMGMYRSKALSVAAGGTDNLGFMLFCTSEGVFSCGGEGKPEEVTNALGHAQLGDVTVPRRIQGQLDEENVAGVAAGSQHALVWTEEGDLFTFGNEG